MSTLRILALAISSFTLTACGGSSDSSSSDTYPDSYIQFYNGSANSANTTLQLIEADDDEIAIGSATFADVTSLVTMEGGSYGLELNWTPASGETATVRTDKVTLADGEKTFLAMLGDFNSPELLTFKFSRDDTLDDKFKVAMLDLVNNSNSYDLYISEDDKAFSDAKLVNTASYKGLTQFQTYDTGSYIFYVTKGGDKTVLFKSDAVTLSYETEYLLVLRSATGPSAGNKLALDLVGNTTSVTTLEDITSNAQFRIYNSMNNTGTGSVFLGDLTATPAIAKLPIDTLSAYTEVAAGDYRVSLTDDKGALVMRNGLMTLSQGAVKSVVFYQDAAEKAAAITVTDSKTPQVYDFVFNAVNTIPDYDQVSLYFVKPGYTMENTAYYITTLNYASQTSVTLPAGEYTMYVVHKDNNNNKILLAQTELTKLVSGSNYLLVAEKEQNSLSGFKLTLAK
ncbi:hypothetical protein [Rheinheimera sp. F8]|uniref:hypothetical protein n=1 Tax=Rheinheimera sp. F8 TaxID=1763998 RepID=UPI00074490B4|nr:hypothetical protein [Rheinheimera sp. F8]ALZ74373.1 hypothetical protein ATY27_00370 [Rheinheimera sp. F8]